MMQKAQTSKKRILIDKNNATMVAIIAAMAFVTVFSIISCKALLGQRSYKARVIKEQKTTLDVLKSNNEAAKSLVAAYTAFVSSGSENKIGGNVNGTGQKDGDNGRIVLDALPSKYDFPAIANSLESLLLKQNFKINEISGKDDEVNQSNTKNSGTIVPIEIPFKVSVNGSFEAGQTLMDQFRRSIRPIKVSKLSLDGKDGSLNIIVEGVTYYQPEKEIKITTKVVK